jgi:hypothetical protein
VIRDDNAATQDVFAKSTTIDLAEVNPKADTWWEVCPAAAGGGNGRDRRGSSTFIESGSNSAVGTAFVGRLLHHQAVRDRRGGSYTSCIRGAVGSCIDVNHESCTGASVIVGYCAGANSIKCCPKPGAVARPASWILPSPCSNDPHPVGKT